MIEKNEDYFLWPTGEKFVHESIIGSKFSCELVKEGPIIGCEDGGGDRFKSVIPQIAGKYRMLLQGGY